MQGSYSQVKGGMSMQGLPSREWEALSMQGSTLQGKGGMANAG